MVPLPVILANEGLFRNSLLTLDIQTHPEKVFGTPKTVLSKWVTTDPLIRSPLIHSPTPSPGHPIHHGQGKPMTESTLENGRPRVEPSFFISTLYFPGSKYLTTVDGIFTPEVPNVGKQGNPYDESPFFHFIKRVGRNSQM